MENQQQNEGTAPDSIKPCGSYQEVEGDLIKLALQGEFDVIAHGCNCFCMMGAGIALPMAQTFRCNLFELERTTDTIQVNDDPENPEYGEIENNNRGNINKLGQIDYSIKYLWFDHPAIKKGKVPGPSYAMNHKSVGQPNTKDLYVVNAYTQYHPGADLSYPAISLCLRKIGYIFEGKKIGLPLIGCGIAGGDWKVVKAMIQKYLKHCDVTIVHYKPEEDGSTS